MGDYDTYLVSIMKSAFRELLGTRVGRDRGILEWSVIVPLLTVSLVILGQNYGLGKLISRNPPVCLVLGVDDLLCTQV